MAGLLDALLGMSGQERTAALRQMGRNLEYYVPPELRGLLGFAAEMTPTATLERAAQAGGEMMAPDRTAMERLGSAGQMLSETAGVAAPMMVAGRAAMPAAQALQEGLLGFSMAADDAGRRFVERMNQPGPVPTMYSNPVDFEAFKKARAQEDFARKIKSVVDDVSSGAYQTRLDEAAFDLHKSGNLPLPVGTRVSPPSSYEMGSDLRISGYWVDPQDTNVFGYKLQNDAGEEFREFVNNPRLGIKSRSADRFGGGFKAFAGPNADDRLGFSAPSTSSIQANTPEPVPDSVQREYDDLFGTSLPAPRNEAEAMAKQVLEMRASGRAGDVTEEMMAATDPQYMFANTPLPMDEASRMARARELGLLDDQYHATTADFQAFMPSETGLSGRGVYTGDYPTDIVDYATKGGSNQGLNVIPLSAPAGSRYARNIDWQRTLDADTEFPYNATAEETIAGFKRAADTMSQQGYAGVHNQAGERVTFNPSDLRSRFARFDPAFAHLRNLSAGVGGLGILSLLDQKDQEREEEIRQYLGGLL